MSSSCFSYSKYNKRGFYLTLINVSTTEASVKDVWKKLDRNLALIQQSLANYTNDFLTHPLSDLESESLTEPQRENLKLIQISWNSVITQLQESSWNIEKLRNSLAAITTLILTSQDQTIVESMLVSNSMEPLQED